MHYKWSGKQCSLFHELMPSTNTLLSETESKVRTRRYSETDGEYVLNIIAVVFVLLF